MAKKSSVSFIGDVKIHDFLKDVDFRICFFAENRLLETQIENLG